MQALAGSRAAGAHRLAKNGRFWRILLKTILGLILRNFDSANARNPHQRFKLNAAAIQRLRYVCRRTSFSTQSAQPGPHRRVLNIRSWE